MSDTRTISVSVEDGKTRHFNVDNIAYLQVMEVEPTGLSVAIYMGIPVVLAIVTFLETNSLAISGIVGIVLFAVLSAVLLVLDTTEIGTLNETYELASENVTDLEHYFRQASRELITVEGTREDPYNIYEYRYHLVPDNIVSISYEQGGMIPVPYIFYGLALFFGAPVASTESTIIGLTGFVVFLIAGFKSSKYRRPDTLVVDFQNGETETFRMSRTDRRRLLAEFDSRDSSQRTVQGRNMRISEQ